MSPHGRLFIRIVSANKEVYALKIITLAIAFASSTLIILFSIHEFQYDTFHVDASRVFRVIQHNNGVDHQGNRLSNRIPVTFFDSLKQKTGDYSYVSRVKVLKEVTIISQSGTSTATKIHVADPEISNIFSFHIIFGNLDRFASTDNAVLLSQATAESFFGPDNATGKTISLTTLGDTIIYKVVAVYRDFPSNSHERFDVFIPFRKEQLTSLYFDPQDFGVYMRIREGAAADVDSLSADQRSELCYSFQSLPDIYFGPRVVGEEAVHGDRYSILIIISVSGLILFLALTSYINLTTLSLPHRAKEMAVRKLAGTNRRTLLMVFSSESFALVGVSLIFGITILVVCGSSLETLLGISIVNLLVNCDLMLISILLLLYSALSLAPLLLIQRFVKATPTRLLSTETITFPGFKRTIIFLQLGISIFLIVASMVIRRQITFSLVKEPGKNFDQVVYLSYPPKLTNDDLHRLRATWNNHAANVLDVLGTSHLPDRVSSKLVNSPFYTLAVDPHYKDFFGIQMLSGNWFRPNAGDSITVINEQAIRLGGKNITNAIGVFDDISGRFNLPEKPIQIRLASYSQYNYLCIRIMEVDIQHTMAYLSRYFEGDIADTTVSLLDQRFQQWLNYQNQLNTLSGILAIIAGVLSCLAVYGLSISVVRDKMKQIAIHKLWGASVAHITKMLIMGFIRQVFLAIAIFGPLTYLILDEFLRTFVYAAPFSWLDPFLPIAYCIIVITLLCGFQALSLNRNNLTSSLKG